MGSFLCNIIGRERKIDRATEKDNIVGGKREKERLTESRERWVNGGKERERKKEWQEERERLNAQNMIKRVNKKDKYWEEEGKEENLW